MLKNDISETADPYQSKKLRIFDLVGIKFIGNQNSSQLAAVLLFFTSLSTSSDRKCRHPYAGGTVCALRW